VRAAAYARVSTGKQDLEVQLEEIRQFAARKGWTLVATYSDVASGAREDRIDFRRLFADAARGKLEVVIVQRFDRAARSVKQLVETLEHLHISPALAHRLAQDAPTVDSTGRSETSPSRFETDPEPSVSPKAVEANPILPSGNRRNL
jgi:DNA invertase Pin-like site-specific DNA recombinase